MTLTESLYSPRPNQESAEEYPRPSDEEAVGAIALRGEVSRQAIFSVSEKLLSTFEEMRAHNKADFRACIAYSLDITEADEVVLEQTLRSILESETDQQLSVSQNVSKTITAWFGDCNRQAFALYKHRGWIALDDGTLPAGVTYSLLRVSPILCDPTGQA